MQLVCAECRPSFLVENDTGIFINISFWLKMLCLFFSQKQKCYFYYFSALRTIIPFVAIAVCHSLQCIDGVMLVELQEGH